MLKYNSSIEKVKNEKSTKADYVYLNINILNTKQGQSFFGNNPKIDYNESLQNSIIDNPSEYVLYISRFGCDCGLLLPIWSPEIIDNQSNPNLCIYALTMTTTINGVLYTTTQNMIYQPENQINPPATTDLYNDVKHYYYVYSFSHVAYLFNAMLQSCYTDLQTQAGLTFSCICPFMSYDASSSLYSLYFDTTGQQFNLYFDNNLYNMFYSFYFRNTNQLVIDTNNGLNNIIINGKTLIKITQDFNSSSMWSPVSNLVFTTSKIPIRQEQNTEPLSIYDDTNMDSQGSYPQQLKKIITDFSIPYDKASDCRNFISYTPSFPRYINLNSIEELKDIDISLWFQDKKSGQLIPVLLPNGGSVNLKLCFKRKNIL